MTKRSQRLDLEFLHDGVPKLELQAEWKGRPAAPETEIKDFEQEGAQVLSRSDCPPEYRFQRMVDPPVRSRSSGNLGDQASSHGSSRNPAGEQRPQRRGRDQAQSRTPTRGSSWVAESIRSSPTSIPISWRKVAVDEAVRNVLCVGADFGTRSLSRARWWIISAGRIPSAILAKPRRSFGPASACRRRRLRCPLRWCPAKTA